MVETVARALLVAMKEQMVPMLPPAPDSWTTDAGELDMAVLARAAIAAMRPATPAMCRIGVETAGMPWSSVIPPDVDPDEYVASMIYGAMIDEALSTPPEAQQSTERPD